MSLYIDLESEVLFNEKNEKFDWIKKSLQVAYEMELEGDCEVAVTVVDNAKIKELNKVYRNQDKVTDVLSFPLNEKNEKVLHLGDIVISLAKAEEQAKSYGHSLARELAFLSVHGFLHLIGYDHETQDEEEIMFSKQSEILDSIGLVR